MKNLLIAMSFLLLIFLWGVPLTSASGGTVVTEKDNGKEIQVKVGDVIELSLEELGSAGYTWEFDQLDANFFKLLKTETRPVGNQPIGGPVLMTWWLKTKKVGDSQLALDYFRSWEGRAKAVKHFHVKVKIQ
ncbi:MAG: protease inhibitor I42 family protein [Desulfobaccales bacterium]